MLTNPGTGPCYAATLTIVVRTDLGEVLYSYVAPFKRHVATHWQDPALDKEAYIFLDRLLSGAVSSSTTLPPFLEHDAYHDENAGEIKISKTAYEQLRAKGRPMLYHPNHYGGWQYVVFDEASGAAVVVVMGGV